MADTVLESGYTCGGSGCARAPEMMKKEHAQLIDRVRETRADVLVTFYHNCHASFVRAEGEGGFRVLNYTDLLVEALGAAPHDDVFKRLRLFDDWKMIVEEAEPYLREAFASTHWNSRTASSMRSRWLAEIARS